VLAPGLEVRDVGLGEIGVAGAGFRDVVTLPAAGADVLPLLDGSRTLGDVTAELCRSLSHARHRIVLETVGRLSAAGMVTGLPAAGTAALTLAAASARPSRLVRSMTAALHVRLFVPFAGPSRSRAACATPLVRAVPCVLLLVALAALIACHVASGAYSFAGLLARGGALIPLMLLLGSALAGSTRSLGLALALRASGRSLSGAGLALAAGIPHLGVDLRQQAMLNRAERVSLALAGLAATALPATVLTPWWLAGGGKQVGALALGSLLALLVDLSPVGRSDGAVVVQEATGTRRHRSRSAAYLFRKLWRDVVARGSLDREDRGMLVAATCLLLYLFLVLAALAALAPAMLDAMTAAVLGRKVTTAVRILAVVTTLYVWAALVATCLALLAAAGSALYRIFLAVVPHPEARPAPPLDKASIEQLAADLSTVPPFAGLGAGLVTAMLTSGMSQAHPPGSVIVRQRDEGDACYVIRSGTCHVTWQDASGAASTLARLGTGDVFGEAALLSRAPRNASVTAETAVEVIALSRNTFLDAVAATGGDPESTADKIRIHLFLKRQPLLRTLSHEAMAALAASVRTVHAPAGTAVLREGDPGDAMFLVYSGDLDVKRRDLGQVAALGPGAVFGEIAVVTSSPRTATVTARTDCVLVEIPSRAYRDILSREFSVGLELDCQVEDRLESLSLV